jgi:chromosome segregation ATPase
MVGKSGSKTKFKEASNSFVNIRLQFLDLPKKVQELIHDGRLGTNAAMDLLKHDKAKHDEIIDKALAANDAEIARDEAAEVKLLNEEKGLTEKSQAAEVKVKEAKAVAATVEEATKAVNVKVEATTAAFKDMNQAGLKPDERKAKEKAFKSVEAELKQARATLEDLKKKEVKVKEQADKAQTAADAAKAKIETARATKKAAQAAKGGKDPKKIGQKGIKTAAAAAGSTPVKPSTAVKLNAGDIRDFIHTFCLPGTPMVVAKVFKVVEVPPGTGVKAIVKHFENLGLNMKEKVGMPDTK